MDMLSELLNEYKNRKNKLIEEKKEQNPDGRLKGYELLAMRNLIEGLMPQPDGALQRISGLGDIKGSGYEIFKTKLYHNLKLIKNEIEVLLEILPKLSEQEKQSLEEFNKKRSEIKHVNADLPPNHDGEIDEVRHIKFSGNWEIYKGQIKALEDEYSEVLSKKEQNNERSEEIFQTPLAKLNFDMIKESEIPSEVSVNERQVIAPMLEKKKSI